MECPEIALFSHAVRYQYWVDFLDQILTISATDLQDSQQIDSHAVMNRWSATVFDLTVNSWLKNKTPIALITLIFGRSFSDAGWVQTMVVSDRTFSIRKWELTVSIRKWRFQSTQGGYLWIVNRCCRIHTTGSSGSYSQIDVSIHTRRPFANTTRSCRIHMTGSNSFYSQMKVSIYSRRQFANSTRCRRVQTTGSNGSYSQMEVSIHSRRPFGNSNRCLWKSCSIMFI